jgi:hypothetical protein
LNETSGSEAVAVLAAIHETLKNARDQLAESERECSSVAELSPEKADHARQRLDEGRGAFREARLQLIRALDLLSLRNPSAEPARKIVLERYLYPSVSAAETLLELTSSLVQAEGPPATQAQATLADELAAAMRKRGHNIKSAAHKMGIADKTLNRMLRGLSTKPVKQQAARRYIAEKPNLR